MNFNRITFGLLSYLAIYSGFAQFDPQSFGGAGMDRGVGITMTNNEDGYLIAGLTTSFGALGEDIYLVRTDLGGNLIWQKTFGGPQDDNAWFIQRTNEGTYLIAGFSNSYSEGDWDIYLIEINESGDEVWSQNLEMPGDQYAWSLWREAEGSYVVVGQSNDTDEQKATTLCVKLSPKGEVLWIYQSSSEHLNRAFGITRLGDDYFISGLIATGLGDLDGFVTSLSATGVEQWTKTYGGASQDLFHAIHTSPDGAIIASGYAKRFEQEANSPWIVKIDNSGQVIWDKSYGSQAEERIVSATIAANGDISLLGYVLKESNVDLLRLQIDPLGQLHSYEAFGSPKDDAAGQTLLIHSDRLIYTGRSLQPDPEGDLILVIEELKP
ncbi:MAG: hypothetical protein R8G66_23075 [Cytophagales bacterium]|nr:hypothetical protein [Cytophagales bacterium]